MLFFPHYHEQSLYSTFKPMTGRCARYDCSKCDWHLLFVYPRTAETESVEDFTWRIISGADGPCPHFRPFLNSLVQPLL